MTGIANTYYTFKLVATSNYTLYIIEESYGRKMMKGYLQGHKGLSISERKIRKMLPSVAPQGHSSRVSSARERRNPALYYARYFGHKLHLDQNEKLVHYGVMYVLARDGF